MPNLPLFLACLQVLLAGSECKIILMGDPLGVEKKFWAFTGSQWRKASCCGRWTCPPPSSSAHAWPHIGNLGKTTGAQRMAQCGNGETAKCPTIMCWPATKPDRKAGRAWEPVYAQHGAHSSGRLSFGRGLPQGAGANETKHWEIGQAWP